MNKVILIGRLTDAPEVKATQSGKSVARFTLAVDGFGKDAKADFIRCIAWDKRADFCGNYLKKGSKVAIVGRISTGRYEDKDGKPVYTTDIVIDDIEFCESKAAGNANAVNDAVNNGFMQIPDGIAEELPFC